MESESKKENEAGRNEPLVADNALNDFFRLLDRQTEDRLPANVLLAMLGLYDVLQIISCATSDTQSSSPKSQLPLRNALMNMLGGKGNLDMGLQEMAQMLGSNPVPALAEMARSLDKNPSALLNLLSLLSGSGQGGGKTPAPPAAPTGQDFFKRPDDGKRYPGTGR